MFVWGACVFWKLAALIVLALWFSTLKAQVFFLSSFLAPSMVKPYALFLLLFSWFSGDVTRTLTNVNIGLGTFFFFFFNGCSFPCFRWESEKKIENETFHDLSNLGNTIFFFWGVGVSVCGPIIEVVSQTRIALKIKEIRFFFFFFLKIRRWSSETQ